MDFASRLSAAGATDGPICRIEVAEPWVAALDGIEAFERIEVLYWLHEFAPGPRASKSGQRR